MESVSRTAVQRVEQAGIIFIDEIDKIASRDGAGGGHGPDVSREGVQRDILPIVEGTTVNTKHGMVKTDHILFIAAGAFHVSKPSDLIPELQGRFPIRVELEPLTRDDFVRILTEPRNALVKQYVALLGTEDLELTFTPDAVERIADFAARVNDIDREHRRPPSAHRDGAAARRAVVRGARSAAEKSSPSTRPTSIACSPTSSRTRISRGTFSSERALAFEVTVRTESVPTLALPAMTSLSTCSPTRTAASVSNAMPGSAAVGIHVADAVILARPATGHRRSPACRRSRPRAAVRAP